MMNRPLCLIALLALAGCDAAPAPEKAPVEATRHTAKPVALIEKNADVEWKTGWPAEAAAIPALDEWFRKDAADSKRETIKAAAGDRAEAKAGGYDFLPHSYSQQWTIEGSPPGLLSLSGRFAEFSGGAHGMSGWQALLWDRKANKAIDIDRLFANGRAAQKLLTAAFCPALDAERAKKRGAPVVANADDPFTQCPELDDQVMVPAGPAGHPFTHIRILIAPYEAGPYAEGGYEVTVPVTAALVALVKPAHRAAFVAR